MINLRQNGDALALVLTDRSVDDSAVAVTSAPPPAVRVETALAAAAAPMTVAALRSACRIRTATLCDVLADLVRRGRAYRTPAGYVAAASPTLS